MEKESEVNIKENTADTAYFSVSLSKFRNMYLLTFSFYCIYWFYKQWQLQNKYSSPNVMPIARAIFALFFTHSLVGRVKCSMENKNVSGSKSLSLYATAFVILIILSNVFSKMAGTGEYPYYFDFIWVVFLYFSSFPLIEIQDNINALKGDPLGKKNSNYTWQNVVIMITGGMIWVLFIIGLLATALGTV